MAPREILGAVALACVAVVGIISTLTHLEMVDKVNEHLPKEEQFDQLGWYMTKSLRLFREYKRLFPDGRLRLKLWVLTALMFACVVVSAWGFGFFGHIQLWWFTALMLACLAVSAWGFGFFGH